jgi:hypothetical protein
VVSHSNSAVVGELNVEEIMKIGGGMMENNGGKVLHMLKIFE